MNMNKRQNLVYNKQIIKLMIDAQTSMKNESLLIEQLSKQEQIIQQKEYSNQQAVKNAIKRYKNKISEMLKMIKMQKIKNDSLKEELKTLNENLNNMISKLNPKSIKNNTEIIKDEVMKKELDVEIKKNIQLQKEVQSLRIKMKGIDAQKIQELQNQLKEKDKKIQELSISIKMYEKIERADKSLDIYKKQQELINKLNSLKQENLHLKGKIAQHKKQEEVQQKKLKRQHQQILELEGKSKNADQSSPLKEKQKLEAQHQSIPKTDSANKMNYLKQKYASGAETGNDKNYKSKSKKSERQNLIQQIQQLQQKCENLEVTKKAIEKHQRIQIENLRSRIKTLQAELSQSKNVLKRKDQEANILILKMKENTRKNYNTLEPVQKLKFTEDFSTNSMFDQRKQFRGLVHTQGNFRKFDDTEGLSLQKNYRIKSFTFTWFEQLILSLDTVYELKDGVQKSISSFKTMHQYKNIKMGGLQLSDFEYIKEMQVHCGKFIEFIKITTSRDKVLEVGNYKNLAKCKKFEFDIRHNEKPIAFLGAIDNKKIVGVEGAKQLLISFGLQIKKKDIVGKSRYNPSRTASLAKYSSKSVLDNPVKNDKNIIDEQQ